MPQTPNNPVEIWITIHELTHQLKTRMLAHLHQHQPEMSFLEMRVLILVGEHPDISQKEVIDKSQVDKSQMTRTMTTLEEGQWLIRQVDAVDRRVRRLRLSDQGNALYAQLQSWRSELAQNMFGSWSPALCNALRKSAESLRQQDNE